MLIKKTSLAEHGLSVKNAVLIYLLKITSMGCMLAYNGSGLAVSGGK